MQELNNVQIYQYSTNTWLDSDESKIKAIKDILNNNSKDYSYTRTAAELTVDYYNIKF